MQLVSCPGTGLLLVCTLVAQLVACGPGALAVNVTSRCKLFSESSSERQVLSKLEPLANINFTAEIKTGEESYTYMFKLCGDAGGIPGAGVIQVDTKNTDRKVTVIGLYNTTQAIGGSDWVMLIYRNGDRYDNHCSQEMRKAMVMVFCNRDAKVGKLKVQLEDRARSRDCFYLLELDSSAICPPLESQLSTGSILLIIGLCLLAVYLIGGFLYQRLVVGAKGMEQFPNYAFWVEFGNLAADGCDFVCRSRNRNGPLTHQPLATEPPEEEPEERDDHLLPM